VKAYPVADGSCAGHLCCMLQRGTVGCTRGAIVAQVRKEDDGGRSTAEVPCCVGRSVRLRRYREPTTME
jgi:hypothetical protein